MALRRGVRKGGFEVSHRFLNTHLFVNEFEQKIQSFIPSEEHSLPPSLLRLQLTTDEEGKNVVLHPSPAERGHGDDLVDPSTPTATQWRGAFNMAFRQRGAWDL